QEREAGKSNFLVILISHWNECKSLILHGFLTQPIRPWWSFVVGRCATVGAENDWCEAEHGGHARNDCIGWLDRICVCATARKADAAHKCCAERHRQRNRWLSGAPYVERNKNEYAAARHPSVDIDHD